MKNKDRCSNIELNFQNAEELCQIISKDFTNKGKYWEFFECFKVENHANANDNGEAQVSGVDLFTLAPLKGDPMFSFYNLSELNPQKYLFFDDSLT